MQAQAQAQVQALISVPQDQQTFGRYRLLCCVASGGMASVYLARLEEIVMTALQRDPRRRFQSAGELEDALAELVLESNASAAPERCA